MSRPKPTLASRPRQPQTKPRSCGIQPAHESLFNRRLRILSPAVRTPELTPSARADTNNRARTLESEHESRLLKNPWRRGVWNDSLMPVCVGEDCSDARCR